MTGRHTPRVCARPTVDDIDCELRDGWFLAQDVNAWTSLAYVAVGIAVVVVVVRSRLPRVFIALGAVLALEGVGSALYHGGSGDVAQLLHDVPLVGALGFIAGWHVSRLDHRHPGRGALVGLGCGLAGGLAASAGGATNVAVAVLGMLVAAAELLARRRARPAVWNAPLLTLGAVAAGTWLAGTSASPLCDEQAWLQPHGAWHVLSALVVLAWMGRALTAESPERAPQLWSIVSVDGRARDDGAP